MQKQIDDAVAIIDPRQHQQEACREDVERESLRLFVSVGMMIDGRTTKQGKAAIGGLAKALVVHHSDFDSLAMAG